MNGKTSISYITGALFIMAAALVMVTVTTPALAFENESGRVISGTVTAINTDSGYPYLSLSSPDRGEITLALDKSTDAWMCNGYVFLHDVKVGDMVDISYFDSGTGLVASSINSHGQEGMRKC